MPVGGCRACSTLPRTTKTAKVSSMARTASSQAGDAAWEGAGAGDMGPGILASPAALDHLGATLLCDASAMADAPDQLLLTVSGKDHPGIRSEERRVGREVRLRAWLH